jgi:hypothetical protein
MIIVWLWDAGSAHGISDDDARAREAAEGLIRDGRARSARVERACVVAGIQSLYTGYTRLGRGWTARPRRGGTVRWVALEDEPSVHPMTIDAGAS